MKKFIVLVGILWFLGICGSALAENWSYIGKTSKEETWYDTQSVKKVSAGIFKLWMKSVWSKRGKYEIANQIPDKKYTSAIVNCAYRKEEIEINCMNLEYSFLTFLLYDKDGKELLRQRNTDDPKAGEGHKMYYPIGEGASISAIHEKVCP